MRKGVVAVLLAALALACTRGDSLAGGRVAPVGRNMVATEYRIRDGHPFALVHVFYVPPAESVGQDGFPTVMSAIDSVERTELHYSFPDHRRHITIDAAPVTILKGHLVQAGGRSFELARGNVFVADVALSGAVRLRQIPRTLAAKDTSPDDVLAAITGQR